MVEKTSIPRKRVLKAGTIEFGGAAINCTIRNLAASGGLLEVEGSLGISRQFVLEIAVDHFRRKCQVVWIKEKRLGVIFLAGADPGG
jgi:hypothetical protein